MLNIAFKLNALLSILSLNALPEIILVNVTSSVRFGASRELTDLKPFMTNFGDRGRKYNYFGG